MLTDAVLLDQHRARPSRRVRRAERRRLRHLDALSARLAELHAISDLLALATSVVEAGWVKGAWFTVATAGGSRAVTAQDLDLLVDQSVTGACLVGGVVQAAGGPATVRSQLVQRTLDLTWHALREDPSQPVRWCPGPAVRTMHVLELTFWNDAPERTRTDVLNLLQRAQEQPTSSCTGAGPSKPSSLPCSGALRLSRGHHEAGVQYQGSFRASGSRRLANTHKCARSQGIWRPDCRRGCLAICRGTSRQWRYADRMKICLPVRNGICARHLADGHNGQIRPQTPEQPRTCGRRSLPDSDRPRRSRSVRSSVRPHSARPRKHRFCRSIPDRPRSPCRRP